MIQPNLDSGTRWERSHYGSHLESQLEATTAALAASGARLVFWPEAAMTFFPADEPTYRLAIGQVLAPFAAELVAGGPRRGSEHGTPVAFNSVFVFTPDGAITAAYDKQRLLPFAEYFPILGTRRVRHDPGEIQEFAAGEPTQPLATAAGRAGVVVCNEAMYPEPASARVADGASYLLNPSNDSWPDDLKFSLEVFDIVRLRAIEQRRTLVRASTSGPSAIVDASGRIAAWGPPQTRAWITGTIVASEQRTFYSRFGDVFGWACLAVTLAALLRPPLVPRDPTTPGRDVRDPSPGRAR